MEDGKYLMAIQTGAKVCDGIRQFYSHVLGII